MQIRRQIVSEALKIHLAGFWQRLEIHDDAGLMLRIREFLELSGKILPRRGVGQHFKRCRRAPHAALRVVVVHHGHDLHVHGGGARLQRLQERGEFWVLVGVQLSIERHGVQGLGNEQVQIVIVQLEGSEAGVIVTHVKGGAQRVVILGNLAERGNLALPAEPLRLGLQLGADGMQTGAGIRAQDIGQVRVAAHVKQEDDQNDREETAGNFQREPGSAPAAALLVVENGLAFRHRDIPS